PPGSGATTPTSSGATTPRSALATKVVRASTTTGSNGAWSLSLAPFAVGDDRYLITVTYSGAALVPDFITTGAGGNPFEEGGWTGWSDLDNGADVSNRSGGFVTLGPCFQTGVLPVSAGGAVPGGSVDTRAFTQPQPVGPSLAPQGNETGALVKLAVVLGEPGAQSTFSSPLADVLPLRRLTGFPTCTADLQFGAAVCSGLVPGAKYSVRRARGADTLSGRANYAGTLVVGPFDDAPPLTGGDVLTLSNGRRVLTTLHLAHLRAVIDGEQTVLGAGSACQPGLYYGAPPSTPSPASSVAGLTGQSGATLTGRISPPSGSAEGFSVTVEEPANGSEVSGSAPAKRTVNCPPARSTIVCDVRYGRLHRTSTIQRLVRGARQSGSRNPVSFTINLRLAFPSWAAPTPPARRLLLGENRRVARTR